MHGVIAQLIWAFLCLILRHTYAQEPDECARVHAIIARGQGGGDDLNVMSTLSDLILQQIPDSTTVGLPYDHENVLSNEAKRLTVHDGAVLMQEFIEEYLESCPDTKLVVIGYSMGAIVMMDAICGTSQVGFLFVAPLERSYNESIIAAIAYGDETYVPGMPWNVGNCTLGIGVSISLTPISPSTMKHSLKCGYELIPRMNAALCDPFGSSLHSYCDYGDEQCCSPYPADGNAAHHTYVNKYNQNVVEFIKHRLATFKV
ncbi:hypothetical protein N7508_003117 [Penicillium antarcticum]|uniref:uncharacterized protein n=1 Tax=Penicillium antarcticum TaxID=416450 RepID=UPI00238E063C|nr:uncharacterized protein N7508_003117 [Penicillium antarcticum]KAJ5312287.1 hypothetical protein N7508_003117 [Penicillium antarcticum]